MEHRSANFWAHSRLSSIQALDKLLEALRLPKKDEMELVSNLPPINRPLRLKIHRRPSEIEPLIASNNFLMPKQLLHPKIPTSIVPVDLIGIFNSFAMIISLQIVVYKILFSSFWSSLAPSRRYWLGVHLFPWASVPASLPFITSCCGWIEAQIWDWLFTFVKIHRLACAWIRLSAWGWGGGRCREVAFLFEWVIYSSCLRGRLTVCWLGIMRVHWAW